MKRGRLVFVLALLLAGGALAEQRFPPPQFESDYELPATTTPHPRPAAMEYVDVAVLAAALAAASWLTLKVRSRRWIVVLMIFSLAYFGFYRRGCVCSVGAIGNVITAVFDAGYALPAGVLLFFVLPLAFTLFFGRSFCAAVCPLGALQDIVLLKPVQVPTALEGALRLGAFLYLGLAVLMAATGSAYIICQYDPFITVFRHSGNLNMWVLSGAVLALAVFVGRPYCRFACPYGLLLRQAGRLSRRAVTITPDQCIRCRLCEGSCPFGAITPPTEEWPASDFKKSKRRLGWLIVLLPVPVFLCGWAGAKSHTFLAGANAQVRLERQVRAELAGAAVERTEASKAFWGSGQSVDELRANVASIKSRFYYGSWLLGAFVGLAAWAELIKCSIRWRRSDYQAHRAGCVGCGRCFAYCPREQVRRKSKGIQSRQAKE